MLAGNAHASTAAQVTSPVLRGPQRQQHPPPQQHAQQQSHQHPHQQREQRWQPQQGPSGSSNMGGQAFVGASPHALSLPPTVPEEGQLAHSVRSKVPPPSGSNALSQPGRQLSSSSAAITPFAASVGGLPSTETAALGQPGISVSFNRRHPGTKAQGLLKPLTTLPPFVPKLLKQDLASNNSKYRAFDNAAVRDLATASRTVEPSMHEFQGCVMIADVKGFTQLTEILSKKGACGWGRTWVLLVDMCGIRVRGSGRRQGGVQCPGWADCKEGACAPLTVVQQ